LRGSSIPTDTVSDAFPLCGNKKVEAGEDCEVGEDVEFGGQIYSCGTDCKYPDVTGLTYEGSIPKPDGDLGALVGEAPSYCGDGVVTENEACDVAIPFGQGPDKESQVYCNANCTHAGTKLAAYWCAEKLNKTDRGDF